MKVFAIYSHLSHLESRDLNHLYNINFYSPFPNDSPHKAGLDRPRGFREEYLNIKVIYMFISQRQGQTPLEDIFVS